MPEKNTGKKIIAVNRKARHDYFVEDTYEAGIALYGTEVKSVRMGQVNLKDSYCRVRDGELYAVGVHISPYEKGNIFNRDPFRARRLLMHKSEILKLYMKTRQDGLTLVPLRLYFKNGRVKAEIGLCRGKKLYDKREAMAQRDEKRENERYVKSASRLGD
jgi:SsrA-binding protein